MAEFAEVFDDIFANCDVLLASLKQLKEPDTSPEEPDLANFHDNLASLAKILSHEATKFAIAHSSLPFPEPSTTQSLGGSLCNASSQLVGCYLLLPLKVGSTFLSSISKEMESLLINVKQFVSTVQNIIMHNGKLESCLPSTGILWEFCDRIPTLPKNNAEAVGRILKNEEHLISDAIKEIEQGRQIVNGEGSNSDTDDDETVLRGAAVELFPSVKGLIKSAAAVLRRTGKLVTTFQGSDQTKLDPLVEKASTLSMTVDDLICSLYTPVNVTQAIEHGSVLSANLRHLLETVKGIAGEEDQQWIEMLTTAIHHNLTNLESKASLA